MDCACRFRDPERLYLTLTNRCVCSGIAPAGAIYGATS